MNETLLLDIDPVLLERVRRLAASKGWSQQATMTHLLEHGLFACEAEPAGGMDDSDADALQSAIAALEQIDNDPGFALIGRIDGGGGDDNREGADERQGATVPGDPTR